MTGPEAGRPVGGSWRRIVRGSSLFLLVAAPLAFGAVHVETYPLFLGLAFLAGVVSWARARFAAAHGEPVAEVPGWRLLLGLVCLALLQLVPLPAALLAVVSPGSLGFYEGFGGAGTWHSVSTSPRQTLTGLAFLAALSLFYGAVFRDFQERAWARRLAATLVGVAFFMTLVGFLQKASADPGRIYGIWKPQSHGSAFGPYVNRSYYAGHVVMAVPLCVAFAVEALLELRRSWRRRARGWTALGEPEASAALLRAAIALFIVAGVLSCGSRTGVAALAASALALPWAFGRRAAVPTALTAAAIGVIAFAFADLDWFRAAFEARSVQSSRLDLWRDLLPQLPDFLFLGSGLNAMGYAYRRYETINKWNYWDQAHNEYYQVLLDFGLLGALLAAGLLFILFRAALQGARASALQAGLLAALVANATANLVDFNWQLPANAATFAALAGLTLGRASRERGAAVLDEPPAPP